MRDGRRRRLGRRKSCSPSTLKNAPAISFPSPNRSWDTYPGIPDRALPYGGVAGRGVQCSMISASEAEAVVHPSRLAVAKPLRLSLVSPFSAPALPRCTRSEELQSARDAAPPSTLQNRCAPLPLTAKISLMQLLWLG